MIALFCLLIVLGLGHCDELPSRFEVESSINRTIDEVEKLIHQDTNLPRLSRSDIVDILFNITSKDIEAYKNKETIEKARTIYQKALMVVLPYNEKDAKENIKELYTKPPIVKIIDDSSSESLDYEMTSDKIPPYTSVLETARDEQPLENLVVTHASEKTLPKDTKTRYKNHKETYSEVHTKMPLKETIRPDSAPIKFSFNLDNMQRQSTVTEGPTTTRRPVFRESSSSNKEDEDVYVVYSTSATVRTVQTSSKGVSTNLKESRTTSLPSKYNQNVLSSDQWRYNAPPSTTQRTVTTSKSLDTVFESTRDKQSFLPTVRISPTDAMMPIMTSVPEDAPKISRVESHKTRVNNSKQPEASIYVTPVPSSSPSSEKSKYSSTYNSNSGGFRRIKTTTTTTTTTTTIRPQVMELLASIGLRPENTTNVEEVFEKNKASLEAKTRIPGSNGLVLTTSSGLSPVLPDSVSSIAAQNTFENPNSEIRKGMNNLTPDVQLLFQRFGLQTSNPTITIATSTPTPTPTVTTITNSYTNFKPLPTSRIKDQDMKEFLATFGLGVNENRQRKAMPVSTERPSLIEAVPSNMRQILENIGLISRKTPKTTTPRMEEIKSQETKFHVFKPHEVRLKDERQRMKINELLDMVKLAQEGKASVKDVRKVADDLLATTKSLKDGPDPLKLEEVIKIYNEDVKNEVKRQQSPEGPVPTTSDEQNFASVSTTPGTFSTESVGATSTTTTKTTTTTSATSDSAKDGTDLLSTTTPSLGTSTSAGTNLVELEESFGATTDEPDPVLPTKRRNGLYFLVDWNSFLEVGDDGSEKVNLRFQPKVGDRSRFLPVTVP